MWYYVSFLFEAVGLPGGKFELTSPTLCRRPCRNSEPRACCKSQVRLRVHVLSEQSPGQNWNFVHLVKIKSYCWF